MLKIFKETSSKEMHTPDSYYHIYNGANVNELLFLKDLQGFKNLEGLP